MYSIINWIGSTMPQEFSLEWNPESDWLQDLTGIRVVKEHIWNLIHYNVI